MVKKGDAIQQDTGEWMICLPLIKVWMISTINHHFFVSMYSKRIRPFSQFHLSLMNSLLASAQRSIISSIPHLIWSIELSKPIENLYKVRSLCRIAYEECMKTYTLHPLQKSNTSTSLSAVNPHRLNRLEPLRHPHIPRKKIISFRWNRYQEQEDGDESVQYRHHGVGQMIPER